MTDAAQPKFAVGDKVIILDVNRREPDEGVVEKVGRTLVHVRQYGRVRTYRIEDGSANDNYGHDQILTPAQYAEKSRREDLVRRLRASGFGATANRVSTERLERIVQILEEES